MPRAISSSQIKITRLRYCLMAVVNLEIQVRCSCGGFELPEAPSTYLIKDSWPWVMLLRINALGIAQNEHQ